MTKMVVKNVLFRMFYVKTLEVKNFEMGDQRKTVDFCKLINLQLHAFYSFYHIFYNQIHS